MRRGRGGAGRGRVLARALLAALLAALVVGAGAVPAQAHAELLLTTPRNGDLLTTAPGEVTLTFSSALASGGTVRVLAPDGTRVDDGDLRRTAQDRVLHVPLRPDAPQGTYVVTWRVVSEDSHPLSGRASYSVGVVTDAAASAPTIAPPSDVGLLLGVTRVLGFGALVVWVGGAVFLLALWREGLREPRVRRLLSGAVVVELVAGAAALLLQGPYVAGLGLGSVLDRDLLAGVLDTPYGTATGDRVSLALLGIAAWVALRSDVRRAWVLLVLGGLAAVTWTAAGHAGSGVWQPLAAVVDVTHLLSVSTWVGGLVVLGLGLRGLMPDDVAVRVLRGWSRWAAGAVVVLVSSGVLSSVRDVRSTEGLTTTAYGGLLTVKVMVVVVMLFTAAGARAALRRGEPGPEPVEQARTSVDEVALAGIGTGPAAALADRPEPLLAPSREALALLRRSVRNETALAGVVLVVTAVLVQTAPPGL